MILRRPRTPVHIRISKLSRSQDVTRSMRQIHRRFRDRSQTEAESLDPTDFGPRTECNLFPSVRLEDMKRYLEERRPELSGPEPGTENRSGLPYQAYSVPEADTGVPTALEDTDCAAVHRIHRETPDGVIHRDIGELRDAAA